MNIEEMVDYFISRSPDFFKDNEINDVDLKHKEIVSSAYQQIKKSNSSNFRNWSLQSDMGGPSDIILKQGFMQGFIRPIFKKIFQYKREKALLQSLLDDLNIIKIIDGNTLLKDNPVHLTPGVTDYYNLGETTVNFRWLRYIYLTKRICDLKVLSDGGVWMDIGPFYGGLQGLVHKYNPKARIVLVDFHHQLCRSYLYLSQLYPDAIHVFPDQISDLSAFESSPEGSFIYVPAKNFEVISNYRVDLASNFFSFGEMKREFFIEYIKSKVVSKSRHLFLVNRFVSAPFFEPTYDSDLTILDYIDNERSIDYFDVFPMHHYFAPYRELFGRYGLRNVSSSYFEYLSSNSKFK
ncbi:putative sugar O-methyltransferase [Alphaproteobacteria bacterium]|nr:putative sugar O-methyltransferase [Alphaproteobacteria bacterium]